MEKKYLGPKEASKALGVHHMTLRNWEEKGLIEVIRTPGGKRMYNVEKYKLEHLKETNEDKEEKLKRRKICYCRVSTKNQKDDLKRQIEHMKEKYPTYEIIQEIGSGLNLNRKKLLEIIRCSINGEIEEIVVAYKDRLARFGYELIEMIVKEYSNGKIIILEEKKLSPQEEMTQDLVNIINVFSARINGLRKYKKEIENMNDDIEKKTIKK